MSVKFPYKTIPAGTVIPLNSFAAISTTSALLSSRCANIVSLTTIIVKNVLVVSCAVEPSNHF